MILKYFLVFWFVLGMVIAIAKVGQPRKTKTSSEAALDCALNLGIIAAIFVWWPS